MILREAIRQVRGFRYMIEQLDICSAVGRRVLYDLPWLDSKSRLEAEFERIQKIMVLFEQPENESRLERLTGKLMQVRDIRGTIGRMAMEQVLDDLRIENFCFVLGRNQGTCRRMADCFTPGTGAGCTFVGSGRESDSSFLYL